MKFKRQLDSFKLSSEREYGGRPSTSSQISLLFPIAFETNRSQLSTSLGTENPVWTFQTKTSFELTWRFLSQINFEIYNEQSDECLSEYICLAFCHSLLLHYFPILLTAMFFWLLPLLLAFLSAAQDLEFITPGPVGIDGDFSLNPTYVFGTGLTIQWTTINESISLVLCQQLEGVDFEYVFREFSSYPFGYTETNPTKRTDPI